MVQRALNEVIKALQARLCSACRDGEGGGVQRSVWDPNGECEVWLRVADRLMNGSLGKFKRVASQGEPDDNILFIFFLLCFFF